MIFVTVGTDFHCFDRLIDWTERWAERSSAEVVVQHGPCRVPRGCTAVPYLSVDEMSRRFREAEAVVCGAGPGTIMDARDLGCVPIVVPRLHELGEVVDDHQRTFAHVLARDGLVALAEEETTLHELLEVALADPGRFRFSPQEGPAPAGVGTMGGLIDELLRSSRPRRLLHRSL